MKKKYIQYRSGLLIGLLILNILSSCVHTRRGLGMDNASGLPNQYAEEGHNENSLQSDPRQGLDMNSTSSLPEEGGNNRDSLQRSSRFSWITNTFRPMVQPLAEMPVEELLSIGEWLVITCAASYGLGYGLGYARNYYLGYADGLLHAYHGFGIWE